MENETPLLEVRNLSKKFGAVQAVKDVSFALFSGEVVALLGDNGAGKSTLCKLISGAYQKDGGEIFWEGKPVDINSPDSANAIGIVMMYQNLALVDEIDIPGNIFLGREAMKRIFGLIPVLDKQFMKKKTESLLERIKISIPEINRPVSKLSGGQRQATAIARAIYAQDAKLLILDEPMAALGVVEEQKVIDLIKALKTEGHCVFVVSHNLDHVFSVADRIIVLHTGKVAGVVNTKQTNREEIVGLIVGGGKRNG